MDWVDDVLCLCKTAKSNYKHDRFEFNFRGDDTNSKITHWNVHLTPKSYTLWSASKAVEKIYSKNEPKNNNWMTSVENQNPA